MNFNPRHILTLRSDPTPWEVREWLRWRRAKPQPDTQSRQHLIPVLPRSAAPTTRTPSHWAVRWRKREGELGGGHWDIFTAVWSTSDANASSIKSLKGSNMMTNTGIKEVESSLQIICINCAFARCYSRKQNLVTARLGKCFCVDRDGKKTTRN